VTAGEEKINSTHFQLLLGPVEAVVYGVVLLLQPHPKKQKNNTKRKQRRKETNRPQPESIPTPQLKATTQHE
jgi:hypothetical protein